MTGVGLALGGMLGQAVGESITEAKKQQSVHFDIEADLESSKITKKVGICNEKLTKDKERFKFAFEVSEDAENIEYEIEFNILKMNTNYHKMKLEKLTKEIDNVTDLLAKEVNKRELAIQNSMEMKDNAMKFLKYLNEHDLLFQTRYQNGNITFKQEKYSIDLDDGSHGSPSNQIFMTIQD